MKQALVLITFLMAVVAEGQTPTPDAHRFWPQWRGPDGTGTASSGSPPVSWSEEENIAWRTEIPGLGSGTPIVWGERLYLLAAIPGESVASRRVPDPDPRGSHADVVPPTHVYRFVLLAVSRADGRILWQKVLREQQPHDAIHKFGTFASASPFTDGERLYAYFGSNGLYATDMEGNLLWEKDLGDLMKRRGFGEGSTPVLHGDKIIILWDHEGQSFITALDKLTGEELWRTNRDEITSWTSPFVIEHGDGAQVVTSATNRVRSYDLDTGELLWESNGVSLNAIPTPVGSDGMVYVTSGFRDFVLHAVDLAAAQGDITDSDAIVWSLDRDTPYVSSPLLYEDTLYFLKSNSGILSSFEAKTGKTHYVERLEGIMNVFASPVAAGGRVYIASREGATAVVQSGPKFSLLGVNELDDGFDASPAVVDDEIYLRGRRYLYRISAE